MGIDPRDTILYAACPLVMAPTFGQFEPLSAPGKRLIATRDGLYHEARSDVLHWLLPLVAMPMPYGELTPFLRLVHGPIPRHMLFTMADDSLRASPKEIAFGVEADADKYALTIPPITSATAAHVTYEDAFDANRLVLDLHSHGEHGQAFFSATDDASDLSRTGPYLAAVIVPRRTYGKSELTFRAVAAPYLISLDDHDALLSEVFA